MRNGTSVQRLVLGAGACVCACERLVTNTDSIMEKYMKFLVLLVLFPLSFNTAQQIISTKSGGIDPEEEG